MTLQTEDIVLNQKRLLTDTGVDLGYLFKDVDGFWYYQPPSSPGLWSDYSLRLVADKLKELNAPWEAQIQRGLTPKSDVLAEFYGEL